MVRPLRDFERLDPTLFRAFMAAAETLNFTKAADKALMTQSGVSQHIAKLESQLGVHLFVRSNKTVLLTDAGRELALHIEHYLDDTASLCERLRSLEKSLTGHVVYAMPGSCLLAPHLGEMLSKRKQFPGIELRILIQSNEDIVKDLLSGHIDFGFVTTKVEVPGLKLVPFCNEEFVLVSSKTSIPDASTVANLLDEDFVTYPGVESYFEAWQHHYFPKSKKRYFDSLRVKGHIESIHGALALIAAGVGCSVVPRHCVESEVLNGRITVISPHKKSDPLFNTIYIGTLLGRRPTRRAQQVMNWFFEMHPEMS